MIERVHLAREAAMVSRYHTTTLLVPETVGHHSFNMANLLLIMTHGEASKALILAALAHDLGEPAVGDIPSPVKRGLPTEVLRTMEELEEKAMRAIHPYLTSLSEEEGKLLSVADKLDGLLKCLEEVRMGNSKLIPIGHRYVKYLTEMLDQCLPRDAEDLIYSVVGQFNSEVLHGSKR